MVGHKSWKRTLDMPHGLPRNMSDGSEQICCELLVASSDLVCK